MNKTKTFALLALTTLVAPTMNAEVKSVIVNQGSNSTSYSLQEVDFIEFKGTELLLVKTDGKGDTYAFSSGDINIIFSEKESSGVETIAQAAMTVFVPKDGSYLQVNGWNQEAPEKMEIYGLDGKMLVSSTQWNGEIIPIENLSNGVYVLRIGDHTAKFKK